MKRVGNLYDQICSIENLQLADSIARKGKKKQFGIKLHDRKKEANILALHKLLVDERFKTSEYSTFKIYEPKERLIFRLPYYPDRITHHAILNILKPYFINSFVKDTYSCIEGRGVHKAGEELKRVLQDEVNTQYTLKLDIKKFYPNVNHEVLKKLLRRKFKDKKVLCLLDGIVDSAPGLPIGNFASQILANFYLNYFDHWLKEAKEVKYYFRYADDIIILHSSKEYLHQLLAEIKEYLSVELKLEVKSNYQIFPTEKRGIDIFGYVYRKNYTRIRKTIKKNYARKLSKGRATKETIAASRGWFKHCNSRHLLKKLIPYEHIQQPEYTTKKQRLHRKANRDTRNNKQINKNTRFQNSTI